MLYTIYQVTHRKSGKVYIGKHQTLDPNDGYMGSGKLVRAAVKKHGVDEFEKEQLYVFETEEEMNAKEAELVTEEFCARDDTYNLCPGGNGGWGYVNTQLLNTQWSDPNKRRESLSVSIRQKWKEDQTYASAKRQHSHPNFVNSGYTSFLGKSHSDETKKKMSEKISLKAKGENNSQFGTCWVTNNQHTIKIKNSDLNSYLSNGYIRGRSYK